MNLQLPTSENSTIALSKLSKLTCKKVVVKDIEELGFTYSGACDESSDEIEIYLNSNLSKDVFEAVFIHELLHVIMKYENYPQVVWKINEKSLPFTEENKNIVMMITSFLGSVIDHPEIYERMNANYNLNLDLYFRNLYDSKEKRLRAKTKYTSHKNRIFHEQQDIVDGLEYFFYLEPHKTNILNLFEKCSPSAFLQCKYLVKAISKLDYKSPKDREKIGRTILKGVKRYARKNREIELNTYWDCVEIIYNQ